MNTKSPQESTRTVSVTLLEQSWQRLDQLIAASRVADLQELVTELLDQVEPGNRRAGSWERSWTETCCGPDNVQAAAEADESSS